MIDHATRSAQASSDLLPNELLQLRDLVQAQPATVRAELEPLLADVLEHALFRGRVLSVARDALERLRLDLEHGPVRPRRHPSRTRATPRVAQRAATEQDLRLV